MRRMRNTRGAVVKQADHLDVLRHACLEDPFHTVQRVHGKGFGKKGQGLGWDKGVLWRRHSVQYYHHVCRFKDLSANGRDCASRVEHFRHHAFACAVTGAVHNLPGATCT